MLVPEGTPTTGPNVAVLMINSFAVALVELLAAGLKPRSRSRRALLDGPKFLSRLRWYITSGANRR